MSLSIEPRASNAIFLKIRDFTSEKTLATFQINCDSEKISIRTKIPHKKIMVSTYEDLAKEKIVAAVHTVILRILPEE